MDDWVIIHSGTKGMRKGVRNYQNPDGTWTELGKARRRSAYGDTGRKNMMGATPTDSKPKQGGGKSGGVKLTLRERIRAKKAEKAKQKVEKEKLENQKAEEKKAEESKSEAEQWEEEKRRIINSGDAKLLEENKSKLSNAEIDEALGRIERFKKSSLALEDQTKRAKGKDFVTKMVERGEKVKKLLETAYGVSEVVKKLRGDEEPAKDRKMYGSLEELYEHRGEMTAKEFSEMYKAVAAADSIKKKNGQGNSSQNQGQGQQQQGKGKKDDDKGHQQQGKGKKDDDKGQPPAKGKKGNNRGGSKSDYYRLK